MPTLCFRGPSSRFLLDDVVPTLSWRMPIVNAGLLWCLPGLYDAGPGILCASITAEDHRFPMLNRGARGLMDSRLAICSTRAITIEKMEVR